MWNYRVLAHEEEGEIFLAIHEVYYNEKGKPERYSQECAIVIGSDIKDLKWQLNKMLLYLDKPILLAGENFPKEFKTK